MYQMTERVRFSGPHAGMEFFLANAELVLQELVNLRSTLFPASLEGEIEDAWTVARKEFARIKGIICVKDLDPQIEGRLKARGLDAASAQWKLKEKALAFFFHRAKSMKSFATSLDFIEKLLKIINTVLESVLDVVSGGVLGEFKSILESLLGEKDPRIQRTRKSVNPIRERKLRG